MKPHFLVAGAFLACASTSAFADSITDGWLHQANHRMNATFDHAGVHAGGRTTRLRMTVGGDGLLYSPRLVASTGSRDLDARITDAVRHVVVDAPPAELSGREVEFDLHIATPATVPLDLGR